MSLYTLDYPMGEPLHARVLLYHMAGGFDAGHVGALAVEQLLMTLPSTRVLTFDTDQLMDYRARRPMVSFRSHSYTDVEMPELALDVLTDDNGTDMLLLHGDEPDFRWQEFSQAVLSIAQSLGVERTVAMAGMPLAVPHTRPVFVHYHGNNPEVLPEQPDIFGEARFPAPMNGLLEWRLGEAGLDSRGVTAGVPHYLAREDYPAGAAALITAAAQMSGLALPVGDLEAAAALHRSELDAEISTQPEVLALVGAMETQYDQLAPGTADADALLRMLDVPTADEIGARLEAYLEANDAEMGRDGRIDGPIDGFPTN